MLVIQLVKAPLVWDKSERGQDAVAAIETEKLNGLIGNYVCRDEKLLLKVSMSCREICHIVSNEAKMILGREQHKIKKVWQSIA